MPCGNGPSSYECTRPSTGCGCSDFASHEDLVNYCLTPEGYERKFRYGALGKFHDSIDCDTIMAQECARNPSHPGCSCYPLQQPQFAMSPCCAMGDICQVPSREERFMVKILEARYFGCNGFSDFTAADLDSDQMLAYVVGNRNKFPTFLSNFWYVMSLSPNMQSLTNANVVRQASLR